MALEINTIHEGNCLKLLKELKSDSVALVVIDPPYNIGKDKRWDKWQTVDAYVAFMTEVFSECERVLKPNGSFYFFHNDMTQIRKLMDAMDSETVFVFKQLIAWSKIDPSFKNNGYVQQRLSVDMMRNYYNGFTEYCLYYTLQDDYIDNKLFIHAVSNIQEYIRNLIYKFGGNVTGANEFYCKFSGKSGNYRSLFFGKSQPILYTEKQYEGLCAYIKSLGCRDDLKPYEEIVSMCDRETFESERYAFNTQNVKNDLRGNSNVWLYPPAKNLGHMTPKPVEMIENIIRHSSNEGDVVLDCFLGSGTTAVAAINTNRNFIGIEREPEYVAIARRRIDEALALKISGYEVKENLI